MTISIAVSIRLPTSKVATRSNILKLPKLSMPLSAANPSVEAFSLLWHRRSTTANCLCEPGPSDDILRDILTIGARVPDHRRVTPFRFVIFGGDARERVGAILAKAFIDDTPDASSEKIEFERRRFLRAPVVLGVVSSVDKNHRTPEWEQILTVGAVCQNILIAANTKGFAAQWLTEWYAYHPTVQKELGLSQSERIAGFIYIGSASENPLERARPQLDDLISKF